MRTPICLVVALTLSSACVGRAPGPMAQEHQAVEKGDAQSTRVQLTVGAGTLDVKGGATKLLEADFRYNVPAWKPSITQHTTGTHSEIEVTQPAGGSYSNTTNEWTVAVNDAQPLDLVAHVGAGEAHLRLGSLNLRSVDLQVGAGEVDMDLRGTPSTSYTVTLQGGVGSATVHLPSGVGISASASGGIGDISVVGLEKQGDRWVNPRAAGSPVTVRVDAHGGVGEIKLAVD